MVTSNAFSLYPKVGNLFKLNFQKKGKVFQSEQIPEGMKREKTIFLPPKYFSFEPFGGASETEPNLQILKNMTTKQFTLKLREKGYSFKGKYRAFLESEKIEQPHEDIFSIFKGFEFRTVILEDSIHLCIDPRLIIRTNCSIDYLIQQGIDIEVLADFSVVYWNQKGDNLLGFLIETIPGEKIDARLGLSPICRIRERKEFKEEYIVPKNVYPESRPEILQSILDNLDRSFDVISLQRKYSFLDSKTASKDRLAETFDVIEKLKSVFPLRFGGFQVALEQEPIRIKW